MKKPVKSALKVKKKKWVQILAPKMFNEQFLGESYVEDKKLLIGRMINCNLMTLTSDPKKQSINVKFKIDKQIDDKVGTSIVKYYMVPSAIKRLVRRKRDRIDDSLLCTTLDNAQVRVKPLILTKGITTNSVKTDIRLKLRKLLIKAVKSQRYETFARGVISGKIKKEIREKLQKVYPLAVCEFRTFELEAEPTFESVAEEKEGLMEEEPEAPATNKERPKRAEKAPLSEDLEEADVSQETEDDKEQED